MCPLGKQDQVVPREQSAFKLGEHGVVKTDDARERGLPLPQAADQVVADLLLDRTRLIGAVTRWSARLRAVSKRHRPTVRPDRVPVLVRSREDSIAARRTRQGRFRLK